VPHVPTPVWGRDELRTGDMWNSNSVISWLIVQTGLTGQDVPLPPRGRAPGWDAGLVVARRQEAATAPSATSTRKNRMGRSPMRRSMRRLGLFQL
jgi:hypothetical protein